MAINNSDIRLMKSERMTDYSDGGGQMTGDALPDNEVNAVWDDVDRVSQVNGAVDIRKLYGAVRSDNTDKFQNSHFIVAQDSDAENVNTLLVSTGSHYDVRSDAQAAIEQYVVTSTRSPLQPVGTQRKGQKSIVMYSEVPSVAPQIGEVLVLKHDADNVEQAVKINDVTRRNQQYTYVDDGKYQTFSATEYTLELTQVLVHEFPGEEPRPGADHPTELFRTQNSDSARFYGTKPLAAAIAAGSRRLSVNGVFSPIVPVGVSETPILDQAPGLVSRVVQPCGDEVTLAAAGVSGRVTLTLPSAFVPGSLRLVSNGAEYRDRGNTLQLMSGAGFLTDASVEATAGRIVMNVSSSRNVMVYFLPGAPVELVPYTDAIDIQQGNRQLTYTAQLAPVPMPGSLRIDYQYQGKWNSIRDDGTGALIGEGASGNVNKTTGSLAFSLPVLPDEGSKILLGWACSPYRVNVENTPNKKAALVFQLPTDPAADSLKVLWSRGSNNYSVTLNGQDELTGHGAGRLNGKEVLLSPQSLPDGPITIEYNKLNQTHNQHTQLIPEITGQNVLINLGVNNIVARSVYFSLHVERIVKTTVNGVVSESRIKSMFAFRGLADGSLYFKDPRNILSRNIVGAIDAAAGTISIDGAALKYVVRDVVFPQTNTVLGGAEFLDVTRDYTVAAQTVIVNYSAAPGSAESAKTTITLPLSDVEVQLPVSDDLVVPGALLCKVSNGLISDRGDGTLVRNWNLQTGAGELVGEINYQNSEAFLRYEAIRSYISNLNFETVALATGIGAATAVKRVVFRTDSYPLRPSGLQFLARRVTDTALLRATSDSDGSISGTFDTNDKLDELPQPSGFEKYNIPIRPMASSSGGASGQAVYDSGLVDISFTQPVVLSSLTYNAVAFKSVPLDPSVLGLDPVKLPSNGQVPIFRPGNTVVIHNTESVQVPTPQAGAEIDCGRANLAGAYIIGANKKRLAANQYSVDKKAGKVTLSNPFSAEDSEGASLTMPLSVEHRIESMAVLGEVNIDGSIELLTAVGHDFPKENSFVSSAVLTGDLQARVWSLFSQKLEQGGFHDTRQGEDSTAKFDDLNYPILISNQSAVKERWKILFLSPTEFQLIGEELGVVGTGTTINDFAPVNPKTNGPYFTIKKDGWGDGWIGSNIVRFNTEAAAAPVWAVRTVLPSSDPVQDGVISIEFRGDSD